MSERASRTGPLRFVCGAAVSLGAVAAPALAAPPGPPQSLDGQTIWTVHLISDVTGDLRVDRHDLLIAMANLGSPRGALITEGDVDADGDVDAADVATITLHQGASLAGVDLRSNEGRAILDELVAGGMAVINDPVATDQWRNSHGHRSSTVYPHDTTVSKTWTDNGHAIATSTGQGWPNNHYQLPSSNYGPGHTVAVSSNWPPNHLTNPSSSWQSHQSSISATWPPTHVYERSRTWTEGDHGTALSAIWPPSHDFSRSKVTWPTPDHSRVESRKKDNPLDHLWYISNTWPVVVPPYWPPNHYAIISETWDNPEPSVHKATVSETWPPNHIRDASETWLPTDPPWWPGHIRANSAAVPQSE